MYSCSLIWSAQKVVFLTWQLPYTTQESLLDRWYSLRCRICEYINVTHLMGRLGTYSTEGYSNSNNRSPPSMVHSVGKPQKRVPSFGSRRSHVQKSHTTHTCIMFTQSVSNKCLGCLPLTVPTRPGAVWIFNHRLDSAMSSNQERSDLILMSISQPRFERFPNAKGA